MPGNEDQHAEEERLKIIGAAVSAFQVMDSHRGPPLDVAALADALKEKKTILSGQSILIPASVVCTGAALLWLLAGRFNSMTYRNEIEDKRLDRMEKMMWTKADQRAWESSIRVNNPEMKVPKTSEVLREVDAD